MFGLGWGELVVIGIVALIAIGPKELPTVLRTLGQWMGKMRRMANEFQGQFQEALREAELHDLQKHAEDISSSVSEFTKMDPLAEVRNDIERDLATPEIAMSGGTPAEPAAEAAAPAALAEPELPLPQPGIGAPLPEEPVLLTNEAFTPAETPPPKPARGGA